MKKVAISIMSLFLVSGMTFAAGSFPANHLEDVTNGSVRWISTTSETGGFAKTWVKDGRFHLHAAFENLADPKTDDFYEGWLVQRNPFQFISTGELVKKDDGYYHDTFDSSIDYTSYDFYVLTLEPNDGDPAPADHIFEWDVIRASLADVKKVTTGNFPADHLENVTNGQNLRGVETSSNAWGFAKTWVADGRFHLHAGFHDLTKPKFDDFYEGWLVQRNPFQFISTGELVLKDDGYYHNNFDSSIDYTSYDFYVLTLEPNDGDPAPADHIFEGDVIRASDTVVAQKQEVEKSDVVINLTGENFNFSQDVIRVKKWDRVTVNFESTGGFHDWGVDEFDAWTGQISPGEKTSVTFVADKAGDFEFYCSVGNHRAQGMVGRLIVDDTGTKIKTTKKNISPREAVIRKAVINRLESRNRDEVALLERVQKFRNNINNLGFSKSKKGAYIEIIDILIDVLEERV